MSRAEDDYMIAQHIAKHGVTVCKAGIARGGASEQLAVDPATLAQLGDQPSYQLRAAAQLALKQHRQQAFEQNVTRGVKRDVTVPPKPAPVARMSQPLPLTKRQTNASFPTPPAASHNVIKERRRRQGPNRRFEEHGRLGKPITLERDHDAVVNGRTLFPSSVKYAATQFLLLKSGEHQRKIGSHVVKGDWAQMPIFTLTLEERATCPRSCGNYRDCYGNHMHWSIRVSPDPTFFPKLERELAALNIMHRSGFVVRLHILGDFFSSDYVLLWSRALGRLPALRVFGYTARPPETEIGAHIMAMNRLHAGRCLIRFSNHVGVQPRTKTIDRPDQAEDAIICPAQTQKSACCGACALCWASEKTIAFLRH